MASSSPCINLELTLSGPFTTITGSVVATSAASATSHGTGVTDYATTTRAAKVTGSLYTSMVVDPVRYFFMGVHRRDSNSSHQPAPLAQQSSSAHKPGVSPSSAPSVPEPSASPLSFFKPFPAPLFPQPGPLDHRPVHGPWLTPSENHRRFLMMLLDCESGDRQRAFL